MCSPLRITILLIAVMVAPANVVRAAENSMPMPTSSVSSASIAISPVIPTLRSVDLTLRTDHTGAFAQMAPTKLKHLSRKKAVILVVVGVAVVVVVMYVIAIRSFHPTFTTRGGKSL